MAAQDESEDSTTSDVPIRPPLLSHQSNSLPSTPRQLARDGPFEARTPPREASSKTHSPRSASGDSNRRNASYNSSTHQNCRFMFTQVSRRRMPYSDEAGGAPVLPKPAKEPKATLDEVENTKLSSEVSELHKQLQPSQENQARRELMLHKLQEIIGQAWPGTEFQAHVFGSSGNLLFNDRSDVDICVTMPSLTTCALAELLHRRGMRDVKCVHAKIRIVKIWDPELQLNCDLNVNNQLALTNTQMVKTYIELDPRVRPLAMIVKYWTRKRIINEASGGTLSSYTWTLLLINYLQTRSPPILPCLPLLDSDGQRRSDFSADLERFHDFGAANKESLGELLFHFFRRHAYEIDFETTVVSVREASLLSKKDKGWHLATNNRLCVEEPFSTDRNLANTADDSAWRGLHLELRRAFDLLVEAKSLANDVCQQYEFREQPKPTLDRTQPTSRPAILTRSLSQSGRSTRGGSTLRGNRNYQGRDPNRGAGPNSRRASSAAAFGHTSVPHYANSQLGIPLELLRPQQQNSMQQSQPASGIHNHLAQVHSSLRAREQELRQQAANLAQVSAESERATGGSAFNGQPRMPSIGSMNARPPMNSSTPTPQPHPVGYPYVRWDGAQWIFQYPNSQPMAVQPANTNASSPLMTPTPGRRELHRDQYSPSTGAAIRSQSQPARPAAPVPMTSASSSSTRPRHSMMMVPPPASHDPGVPYQMLQAVPQQGWVGPFLTSNGWALAPASTIHSGPREYLGYGITSPPMQPQYDNSLSRSATYDDLRVHGRQTPLGESKPRFASSVPEVSRSPSPLRGINGYSEGLTSPTLTNTSQLHKENQTSAPGFNGHSSPLIVNGSYNPDVESPANLDNGRPRRLSESDQYIPSNFTSRGRDSGSVGPTKSFHSTSRYSASRVYADSESSEYNPTDSEVENRESESNRRDLGHEVLTTDETNAYSPITGGSLTNTPEQLNKSDDSQQPHSLQSSALSINENTATSQASPLGIVWPAVQGSSKESTTARGNVSSIDLELSKSRNIQSSAQLLSPVQETRTPSPTSSRKRDSKGSNESNLHINGAGARTSLNGDSSRGSQSQLHAARTSKEGSSSSQGESKDPKIPQMPPIASSSSRASPASTNPWQQAGGKKAARKARLNSQSNGTNTLDNTGSSGQPLPANASERKGG